VSKEKHDGRLTEILEQIRRTGAYDHTFEELEHGSRVAWRNAGKCINRQVHGELQLLDRRGVKTNAEFFECLVDHLRRALAGEAVTAVISIFRASAPSSKSKSGAPVAIGPRIWNNQLVRFAGHELPGGKVLGDPAELQFTKLLKKVFGWAPSGEPSMFDILPLILQIHPNEPPEIFELPKEVARVVDLTHPRIAGFGDLGLKWSVATPPHLDHPVACDPSRLRYKIPARE
jgi:nitric oxide synthase oxygenase domain/subunit